MKILKCFLKSRGWRLCQSDMINQAGYCLIVDSKGLPTGLWADVAGRISGDSYWMKHYGIHKTKACAV